jgi:hypothetical protein
MPLIRIAAVSAEEASRIYATQRSFSRLDPVEFPAGIWRGKHITFDGRVWDLPSDPESGRAPLYCPTNGYRDEEARP